MKMDTGFNRATNIWSGMDTSLQDYKETVAYDPNGNITQYFRNGTSTVNLSMDSLNYFYNKSGGKLINNQLNYTIRDEISGTAHNSNYPNDIDDQSRQTITATTRSVNLDQGQCGRNNQHQLERLWKNSGDTKNGLRVKQY